MDFDTFHRKQGRLEELQAKLNEMTVGERYSQAGQQLLDEWSELLDDLRASGYPISLKFW